MHLDSAVSRTSAKSVAKMPSDCAYCWLNTALGGNLTLDEAYSLGQVRMVKHVAEIFVWGTFLRPTTLDERNRQIAWRGSAAQKGRLPPPKRTPTSEDSAPRRSG